MGFQKQRKPEQWATPFMAMIRYHGVDGVSCSCGWTARSGRPKVREDKIDRHLMKRHNGQGMRMPS